MPKIITSPIPEFPGTVTLCDPLNLEQGYHISVALESATITGEGRARKAFAHNKDVFEALEACVEKWEIQGQPDKPTYETFVASPATPAQRLLNWMFRELTKIYFGEIAVPNV